MGGVNASNVMVTDENNPQLVTDGNDGTVITWEDTRSTTTGWDIYAQRIFSGGKLHPSSPLFFPIKTKEGKTAIIYLE